MVGFRKTATSHLIFLHQMDNFVNMSFCDKMGLVVVPCAGLSGIMNRGISDVDIQFVNQPPTPVDQLPSFADPGEQDASCSQHGEPDLYTN